MGVRAPATITTSVGNIIPSLEWELSLDAKHLRVVAPPGWTSSAHSKAAESPPPNRSASLLRRFRHDDRVSTLLPRFFHAEFGPVDQVRHYVFNLVLLSYGRLHDPYYQC